jgi:hypothetical protein
MPGELFLSISLKSSSKFSTTLIISSCCLSPTLLQNSDPKKNQKSYDKNAAEIEIVKKLFARKCQAAAAAVDPCCCRYDPTTNPYETRLLHPATLCCSVKRHDSWGAHQPRKEEEGAFHYQLYNSTFMDVIIPTLFRGCTVSSRRPQRILLLEVQICMFRNWMNVIDLHI